MPLQRSDHDLDEHDHIDCHFDGLVDDAADVSRSAGFPVGECGGVLSVPAPDEGGWRDCDGSLTVAGPYLALRRRNMPMEPELQVLEDDFSEPTRV